MVSHITLDRSRGYKSQEKREAGKRSPEITTLRAIDHVTSRRKMHCGSRSSIRPHRGAPLPEAIRAGLPVVYNPGSIHLAAKGHTVEMISVL
jgi:hypothetical protein